MAYAVPTEFTDRNLIFDRLGDSDLCRHTRTLLRSKKVLDGSPKREPRSSCHNLQCVRTVLRRDGGVCCICYVEWIRRGDKKSSDGGQRSRRSFPHYKGIPRTGGDDDTERADGLCPFG